MIGRLRGCLARKSVESVIVEIGGEASAVGYEVFCPLSVLDRLPPEGEVCILSIHTHVREEQLALFGFIDDEERGLFRMLIGVTGVGPKLALACLSGLPGTKLARAIVDKDVRRLSSIPGIGKRSAERLVLELSDKIEKRRMAEASSPTTAHSASLDDLDSALRNLGYKAKDVDKLIEDLGPRAADMGFEDLLREALQRVNR